MSHELDITNGIAAFADSRTDAWHQLGQQVGHAMTAEEVMIEAHLGGWNVRKIDLQTVPTVEEDQDGNSWEIESLEIPDRWANVRTNPVTDEVEYLGMVGSTYQAIQNEDLTGFLNALTEQSGAHFQTAGSLYGGKQVFATMLLPETITLDGHEGVDETEIYISALNRHDGRGAFRFVITPVRIVCRNTQDAALDNALSSFSIWHTKGATDEIAEARRALGMTKEYVTAFTEAQKMLLDIPMDTGEFVEFADIVTGVTGADTSRKAENRSQVASSLIKLWTSSPTLVPVSGTRLGAFNVVTEYVDHLMPVKGGDDNPAEAARLRALRTISMAARRATAEKTTDLKGDAWKLLTKV